MLLLSESCFNIIWWWFVFIDSFFETIFNFPESGLNHSREYMFPGQNWSFKCGYLYNTLGKKIKKKKHIFTRFFSYVTLHVRIFILTQSCNRKFSKMSVGRWVDDSLCFILLLCPCYGNYPITLLMTFNPSVSISCDLHC